MRLDRLLSIVIILLNRKKTTASELSERFEVSTRTIYRDIDAINQAGIPIITYSGNNGGFGIMENYKIDRHLLKLDDMFKIISLLRGINTTFEDEKLDTVINKISNLVPKEKQDQMELYSDQIVFDMLPWGVGREHQEKLGFIQTSIFENALLKFFYRNRKGEAHTRAIEPMTLIFKGHSWYLFGWCQLKSDFRLFKLSRMKNIEKLEQGFVRRNISYKNFFTDHDCREETIDLILKFSPKVRTKVEDYFREKDIKITRTGELLVNVSLPQGNWVYSMILGFGENVEVLSPPDIRENIAEKIKNIAKKYKPDIQVSKA